jgi:hypothetical protein
MDRMNEELPPEIAAALKALDERAAALAAGVDVEGVAARVLERLRHEEKPRFRWTSPAVLRVAAAVVLVVAAGAVVTSRMERPQQTAALKLPLSIPAADSLDSGQLEAVVKAAGEVRPVVDSSAPTATSGSYDDLSDQQLETLLASLKGAEG